MKLARSSWKMTQDDRRPNTAGCAKAPGLAKLGPRPGSAADVASPVVGDDRASPLKAPSGHMKIADIVNRNRRKTSSSADLIKDFEGAVRKVVDGKRSECDKLKYTAEKKRDELDKLKLALRDLRADCAALGMNEFPDPSERLESISSVSRRPLYAKKTNIRVLEEQLRLKVVDTIAVMRKTLTYDHIKKRHEMEKAQLLKAKADLTQELREKQQRLQECHRVELSASESLNQVQTRLVQLKADIAADIRLYETELHLRQRWIKEKTKFESFYANQVVSAAAAATSVSKVHSPAADKRKMQMDRKQSSKHWKQAMTAVEYEVASRKEQQNKDAFLRLGVPRGVVDPAQIIAMCGTHDTLKQELLQRQAEQVQILAATNSRIDEVKAELQQSQLGTVRSSDRDLQDAQDDLVAAEKAMHKAREEYEYMHQMMQPVKAGILQIVAQVTGKTVDVDNIHAIQDALQAVEKELLQIIPDLTAPATDEAGASGGNGSPAGHAAPSPLTSLAPGDVTSPYNIRIRPKEHWTKGSSATGTGKIVEGSSMAPGVVSKKGKDKGPSEDGTGALMDRTTVKQLASTMAAQNAPKKKKP
ncbi:hypothetical protein H310_07512 [Aphanomyces invadans]|uniref:Uncharacterized protein n=1 Tax=Aphanomyces invadans TaxID=157072 RepID=A0A024U0X9_9STRA|nr:hypothetical protein H310_07512 [Aphanomyces invadans]ETW00086.1 hypothetical protein H310_07512 [Aphanomyces invadans]|eukprot:XP_008871111.1 hypothetical protein H310_07512 [Aphanomyces invadans]